MMLIVKIVILVLLTIYVAGVPLVIHFYLRRRPEITRDTWLFFSMSALWPLALPIEIFMEKREKMMEEKESQV